MTIDRRIPSISAIACCVAVWLLLVPSPASAQQDENAAASGVDTRTELSAEERLWWRTLAQSRFVTGDVKGALDALNVIGEPRIGDVRIDGLVRTKRRTGEDYLDLAPGELLTADGLTRAERRLAELPVATRTAVRYDTIAGSAIVRPIVFERDPFPATPLDWTPVGIRVAFTEELRVPISDVAGRGELWTPSFRWAENRPRAMLDLRLPAPAALPGILRFQTSWERQTYRHPASAGTLVPEERFRAGAALADWLTGWLRWEGGAAIERIDSASYLGLNVGLNARALGDRVAVIVSGGRSLAVGPHDPFLNGEAVITARTTASEGVPVFTVLAGVASASKGAPLAAWPGAGSGQGRAARLRAHPLLRDGIVTGEVFGRQLLFTSAEYVHPVPTRVGSVGLAAFVDAAQARSRLDPAAAAVHHVDVGGGLRFNISRAGSQVRVDFGYGLRDGRMQLSAGYVPAWGRRESH